MFYFSKQLLSDDDELVITFQIVFNKIIWGRYKNNTLFIISYLRKITYFTSYMASSGFKTLKKKKVKCKIAPYGLQTLFFAPSVLLFIIGGTCALGKDVNGTSVYFFIQN
jgi:hypothetical protein